MPVPGGPADFTRPSAPRIYDYLLGGRDNFAPDRELAERLTEVYPGMRDLVRGSREFILKAAGWAARVKGVSQFLDLGCGLPAIPSVHAAVRDAAGLAAVCYVDNDPVVAAHVRAALDGAGPGLAAAEADVTDPAAVLADKGLLEVIDLSRPCCAIFGGTLSGMEPDVARKTVAGFAAELAPGSCVIISCVSYADEALAARMSALFGDTGQWRNHAAGDVEGFFGGLRIVHGRVMDVRCWPACPASGAPGASAGQVLGGIGVLG